MTRPLDPLDGHSWSNVVTAALLGTDRRPLDAGAAGISPGTRGSAQLADPVTELLDVAAAYRSALQAGSPLAHCPVPDVAPAERLPAAPAAAQDLLGELLARPEPALVNAWLSACVSAGLGAPVEHWPRLADLSARSRDYDRVLLRQALGPRGLWFVAHNPRWAQLVEEPAPPTDPPDVAAEPWEEALGLMASGRLGAKILEVAQVVAVTIPLPAGRALLPQLESIDKAPAGLGLADAVPASRPAVERGLWLIRRTISARMEIEESFRHDPSPRPGDAQTTAEAAP